MNNPETQIMDINLYCIIGQYHTCKYNVFYLSRERVRAKDVRVEDRVFMVPPQVPPGYDIYRTNTQENFTQKKSYTVA